MLKTVARILLFPLPLGASDISHILQLLTSLIDYLKIIRTVFGLVLVKFDCFWSFSVELGPLIELVIGSFQLFLVGFDSFCSSSVNHGHIFS